MNFMTARWQNLIMANYAVSPEILKPFLPAGTELDYFEGQTYVSLVGFLFTNIQLFGVSAGPFDTFEEINLRFYVIRRDGKNVKRGVVFINETVPYKVVAWLANKLYKEHYTAIPTKRHWEINESEKKIEYFWKIKGAWNFIKVKATPKETVMVKGSIEEFIFEHYYGYTQISKNISQEYMIAHISWMINKIDYSSIVCDFSAMYGDAFAALSTTLPNSIMLAIGSDIAVNWNRTKF